MLSMQNEKPRISRLLAIITQLQSKKVITAQELAERHQVSTRTIYRDIRTLEKSGVPVYTEEGKGFSIIQGYFLPPLQLTEEEINTIVSALHLIEKTKDTSLIETYKSTIIKLQSLLKFDDKKNKATLLKQRTHFVKTNSSKQSSTKIITSLQKAITNFQLCDIVYQDLSKHSSNRVIEPFAIFNTQDNFWILIAFCRLRNDFRNFRVDRIESFKLRNETFPSHNLTLQEYYEKYAKSKV